ncbi:DUF2155 domain-containing protein [Alsobacter sp. R-9]
MPHPLRFARPLAAAALAGVTLAVAAGTARADKIRNPVAIFAGLDKITGRIISFDVNIDETVQFGALQLTPRLCYTRPPTEPANTTAFIEVDEVTFTNEYRRIFGGWVFASSPGLHGIEHPIYDVWLTGCKGGTEIIPDPPSADQVADPLRGTEQQRAADRRRNQGLDAPVTGQQPAGTASLPPGSPAPQLPPGVPVPPGTVPGGQIGIAAPAGTPTAPRQPTQRFFPATSATPSPNRDPFQNSNR